MSTRSALDLDVKSRLRQPARLKLMVKRSRALTSPPKVPRIAVPSTSSTATPSTTLALAAVS